MVHLNTLFNAVYVRIRINEHLEDIAQFEYEIFFLTAVIQI